MEEETQKIKKLIFIGKAMNNELENVCREKQIVIIQRFQNEYNMTELFKESLQAISNIDFLVLDIAAFISSTDEQEIIRNLDRLRTNYRFRIIIIASGHRKGNSFLANCFNMGIYNLITASNSAQMYDNLKLCLSDEGMNYAQASQYRADLMSITNRNTEVIKTEYERVRQDVTIGIVGATRHIGTTSWGINLLLYFDSLPNVKACLIEENNHNDIIQIANLSEINRMGIEHFETAKEVKVGGMELFYDISKIADIKKEGYDFYIYDFGSLEELTDTELVSFMNKDIKFIITGARIWEEKYLLDSFAKLNISEGQDGVYFICNFTKPSEQKKIKESMGNINIYFNDYEPDSFIPHSQGFLEEKLKRYLSEYNYEEVKKKRKFSLFGR